MTIKPPLPDGNKLKWQLSPKTPIDIPIIHSLYDAYTHWHQLQLKFPKSQRYTLGLTCQNYLLGILEQVIQAASTTNQSNKIDCLRSANTKLDLLRILVRLAKDCQCLPNPAYLELESKFHEIGRMLGGWLRSSIP